VARGVPLILIGGSEGGDVAAAAAAAEPAVTHLVLLASGGGLSQAEELRLLVRRPGGTPGIRDEADLDAALARIRAAPRSTGRWLGLPHHRWSSYLWDPPVRDLLRRPVPTLVVHGDADDAVPVESARALAAALAAAGRRDLRYVELAGVDHRLRHRATGRRALPLVELAVLAWLGTNGVLTAREAGRHAARVRRAHPEWFGQR
jgi:pimeloyl-ACP methyl ester carboxylesterase